MVSVVCFHGPRHVHQRRLDSYPKYLPWAFAGVPFGWTTFPEITVRAVYESQRGTQRDSTKPQRAVSDRPPHNALRDLAR